LRALASRLLAGEDASDAVRRDPQLFVGRLPDDLLVEIPVPSSWVTVVGSLVRDDLDLDDPYIEIVLSTELPTGRFHETYAALMVDADWSEIEPWLDPQAGLRIACRELLSFIASASVDRRCTLLPTRDPARSGRHRRTFASGC
jgi:hypothetical protein